MPNQFTIKRIIGLLVLFGLMFGAIWWMQVTYGAVDPSKPPAAPVDWTPYRNHAWISIAIVVVVDILVIAATWLRWRRKKAEPSDVMPVPNLAGVSPEALSPNKLVQNAVRKTAAKQGQTMAPTMASAVPAGSTPVVSPAPTQAAPTPAPGTAPSQPGDAPPPPQTPAAQPGTGTTTSPQNDQGQQGGGA